MTKISQQLKRAGADRKGADAPASPAAERGLAETLLDQVAAAGGKSTTSGNPVED